MAREYVRLAGRFKDLAFRDPVTDLGNRRAFYDRMHARTGGRGPGALLVIDVDGFEAVNDTHGHATGDVLLRRIGGLIGQALRSHDFVARIGGDEFGVLLGRATRDEARVVASRIKEAIADDAALPVTVSIGLAALRDSVRATVLAADAALYEAKAAGRNGVREAADAGGPLPPASARKAIA
ncbi:MAG TPA: GGDEF domain-containing protein [Acidimicrobiales bacterium]|nr:GGDEF domain-containing protein [Acidimicrobiales bacterium]